jgi:hypothetical protein
MSVIKPTNIWNSFNEYQEYQLSGNTRISNIYYNKNNEFDEESEDEHDEHDEFFGSNEIKEEKPKNESNGSNGSNVSYVSPLPSKEIIDIVKNIPGSSFNSFGRIVFDKPFYLSDPNPTNASLFDNLTISYIENQINEDEHKHTRKEFIQEVFNIILNIISKDDKFKIVIQNTFYEMEVSFIEENLYNEKFKISLYTDNENNNGVIIEMKGIKRDNVCNLFFFYNINEALGSFYDVIPYKNIGNEEEEYEVGINYLPHSSKKNIYLMFKSI